MDVRTAEEYNSGAIPSAINIPYDVIADNLPTEDRSARIILYCRSGSRSSLAMPEPEAKLLAIKQLRQLNFTGTITATALFSEELELFKKAGADDVYNYYEGVGSGFAERTLAYLQLP